MREPRTRAYYAIRDEDNLPRTLHSDPEKAPADAIEITREQAEAISRAYRTERPKPARADPEGLAVAVLNECRDSIVAVVNEASAERDEAMTLLMQQTSANDANLDARLTVIENIIAKLAEKADDTLGGEQ